MTRETSSTVVEFHTAADRADDREVDGREIELGQTRGIHNVVDERERGHGAGRRRLGEQREDAEHGEAAVVDLDLAPAGLCVDQSVRRSLAVAETTSRRYMDTGLCTLSLPG